jgi:hypothetical protein
MDFERRRVAALALLVLLDAKDNFDLTLFEVARLLSYSFCVILRRFDTEETRSQAHAG